MQILSHFSEKADWYVGALPFKIWHSNTTVMFCGNIKVTPLIKNGFTLKINYNGDFIFHATI